MKYLFLLILITSSCKHDTEKAISNPLATLAKNVFLRAKTLEGTVIDSFISSAYLFEDRGVTMYIPDVESTTRLPVVYMVDGQNVNQYAYYIDTLISMNKISPICLIGIHNKDGYPNNGSQSSIRYYEYVKGDNDKTSYYTKHKNSFLRKLYLTWRIIIL